MTGKSVAIQLKIEALTGDIDSGPAHCHTSKVGGTAGVEPTILWDNTGDLQLRFSHGKISRNADTIVIIAEDYSILQPGDVRSGRARHSAGEVNVVTFI